MKEVRSEMVGVGQVKVQVAGPVAAGEPLGQVVLDPDEAEIFALAVLRSAREARKGWKA